MTEQILRIYADFNSRDEQGRCWLLGKEHQDQFQDGMEVLLNVQYEFEVHAKLVFDRRWLAIPDMSTIVHFDPVRVKAIVSGRVQGVGFREFVKERAIWRGIDGIVRNMRDGTVEIIAEGQPELVQQFLDELHEGPPVSRVDAIEVEWSNATGEFDSSKIGNFKIA